MNNIGAQIIAAREKKGMLQKELAKRADVTPGAISAIETGRVWPRLDTAARIALALDMSLDKLMGINWP